MAKRKIWDKYEAAILLEAVLNIENNTEKRSEAIERVSKQLRSMAQNQGLSIDSTYRNANGTILYSANRHCVLQSVVRRYCKLQVVHNSFLYSQYVACRIFGRDYFPRFFI